MARRRPFAAVWFGLLALALVLGLPAGGGAAVPALTVLTPTEGAVIHGDSLTVAFQVSDFAIVPSQVPVSELGKRPDANRPGEGHVHLMLDLGPLVIWEQAAPYTFTGVPAGEHHLVVELVNNDHSSLTPAVVRQIRVEAMPAPPRAGVGQPVRGGLGVSALTAIAGLVLAVAIALVWRRSSLLRG